MQYIETSATFSPCRRYRYHLWRRWADVLTTQDKPCVFVMLNPSTADARSDDPTIRRCAMFARDWGYGQLRILNIFAFRATDPKDMIAEADPVGPGNQQAFATATADAGIVVCAWGVHGAHRGQDRVAERWLSGIPLFCLGRTKDGHPRHPLYVPSRTTPMRFLPTLAAA